MEKEYKEIGKRIREIREKKRISQTEAARHANIARPYLSDLERGRTMPSINTLQLLSKALNCSISDFFITTEPKIEDCIIQESLYVPILKDIRADISMLSLSNQLGSIRVDKTKLSLDKEYFALQVKGDSMDKYFSNGDIILVERTSQVEDMDIAVVTINSELTTVKKVRIDDPNKIALVPCSNNPIYKTQLYNMSNIIIQGKFIAKVSQ